jgi:phosphonate transport system substrate-binding protein
MVCKRACTKYIFLSILVRLIAYYIVMVMVICSLTGCDDRSERKKVDLKNTISDEELCRLKSESASNAFLFGFDQRRTPEEDSRQYLPLLNYLGKSTGYQFKLCFTPKNKSVSQSLGTGGIHFAIIGVGSYLKAYDDYNIIPMVRGLNTNGKAEYQSVIIVSFDSKLLKIEDVCGKKFAFGNISSTQGHLIPRIILAEHGLKLDDLDCYEYTGSHYGVANAITSGRFDVGGIQGTMGRELAKNGKVRILYTSRSYPSSGIAANRNISKEIISRVKQALIDFQPRGCDAAGLYNWNKTEMPNGFVEARDKDYKELREWAVKFGYLSNARLKCAMP